MCMIRLSWNEERLKAGQHVLRVNQIVTIFLIKSSIHILDHYSYPVETSLIHIESRKSPTAMLFDDDTGRISIRHLRILKEYHLNVRAESKIMPHDLVRLVVLVIGGGAAATYSNFTNRSEKVYRIVVMYLRGHNRQVSFESIPIGWEGLCIASLGPLLSSSCLEINIVI
ncbi:hypothetical protein Tco_1255329 [Tanacetum coccineum]